MIKKIAIVFLFFCNVSLVCADNPPVSDSKEENSLSVSVIPSVNSNANRSSTARINESLAEFMDSGGLSAPTPANSEEQKSVTNTSQFPVRHGRLEKRFILPKPTAFVGEAANEEKPDQDEALANYRVKASLVFDSSRRDSDKSAALPDSPAELLDYDSAAREQEKKIKFSEPPSPHLKASSFVPGLEAKLVSDPHLEAAQK